MSNRIVRRLMESRLATWAASKSLPVAYENVPFDPPTTTHLRAYLLVTPVGSVDLAGDHRQYIGLFQVSIVAPIGNGPGDAEALADELGTLYPLNLRLSEGAFVVQTTTPMSASSVAVQDDDAYSLAVRLRYRADTI